MSGRQEVASLRSRLDATLSRAPAASLSPEVQSDFAKYFCVLVSGFLENAVIELVLDMAAKRSAPEVALFVERKLENWTNAKAEKIVQLLGSFKNDWRQRIDAFLVDQRKDHIDSLIALRHRIAHGHSVGTSLGQVKAYYQTAIEVVEFVANLVDPMSSSAQN